MERARARSCPSVYRRKKTVRSWDNTANEAERLLDKLKSSDETSEKPGAPVPETREQRIRSTEKKKDQDTGRSTQVIRDAGGECSRK